jgi:hypothetical protein
MGGLKPKTFRNFPHSALTILPVFQGVLSCIIHKLDFEPRSSTRPRRRTKQLIPIRPLAECFERAPANRLSTSDYQTAEIRQQRSEAHRFFIARGLFFSLAAAKCRSRAGAHSFLNCESIDFANFIGGRQASFSSRYRIEANMSDHRSIRGERLDLIEQPRPGMICE